MGSSVSEIPEGDRIAAEKDYVEREGRVEAANFPDKIYRERRARPLLLIQPLDLSEDDRPVAAKPPIAWSISLPVTTFEYRTVEYVVNTTWWSDYVTAGEDAEDEVVPDAA